MTVICPNIHIRTCGTVEVR